MPVEGSAARAFREAQRVGAAPPPRSYLQDSFASATGLGRPAGGAFFGAAAAPSTTTGTGGATSTATSTASATATAVASVANPGAAAPLHERQQYLKRMQKMRSTLIK